jgi:hypothetical protein
MWSVPNKLTLYTECRYADCHYADSRGATVSGIFEDTACKLQRNQFLFFTKHIVSVTVGSVQRFLGKCDGAKSRGAFTVAITISNQFGELQFGGGISLSNCI